MRCDQLMYLNSRGRKIAGGKDIRVKITVIKEYLDGGHPTETETTEMIEPENIAVSSGGTYSGYDEYPLHIYLSPSGDTLYWEALQEVIWSSGPMMFLALKDESGNWIKESLWTPEEMENA